MNILSLSSDKTFFDKNSDTFNRIKEYSKLVNQVVVVVFNQKKEYLEIDNKIFIYSIKSKNIFCGFIKSIFFAFFIKRKHKIDVVTSQDPFLNGFASLIFSKIIGAKLLCSVYGTNIFDSYWSSKKSLFFKRLLAKFVFKNSHAIQADGLEAIDDLKKKYGDKVFWKPMIPYNIKDFFKDKISHSEINIIYVGRMVEQKNIPLLIDILEKVVGDNRGINFRFKIVGQGPFLNYFQEQIKLRKIDSFIDFRKSLNRDEIVDLFLKGDFFILCSRFEGFPRVFMESAASALPVITTRVGGIKGILKDRENSFIIEQGDFSGFVDRVNLLIRDNDLRKKMSEAIKNNFRNNYSFELTIDSQKKIFDYLEAL